MPCAVPIKIIVFEILSKKGVTTKHVWAFLVSSKLPWHICVIALSALPSWKEGQDAFRTESRIG
jgi:hypothetical protein